MLCRFSYSVQSSVRSVPRASLQRQSKSIVFPCQNFMVSSKSTQILSRNLSAGSGRLLSAIGNPELDNGINPKNSLEVSNIDESLAFEAVANTSDSSGLPSPDFLSVPDLVEPSFSSLGLAHWYPSGWLQSYLEFLHIDVSLPWWQAVVVTTITLRILVFPVMLSAQRNGLKMNHNMPTIQRLQVNQQLAQMRGDLQQLAFANKALLNFMNEAGCHPIKGMLPMLGQAACFTSMFFALRGMAELPVDSLKTGGLSWFTDLTLSDPTFILPTVACSTIYLMMYLGADGMDAALSTMPPLIKKVFYILPLFSVPVMIYFPSVLNVYWCTNNIISLVQSRALKNPEIRKKLNLAEPIEWKPSDLPMTNFQEEMKKEMSKQKSEELTKSASVERKRTQNNEQEYKIGSNLREAFKEQERKKKRP